MSECADLLCMGPPDAATGAEWPCGGVAPLGAGTGRRWAEQRTHLIARAELDNGRCVVRYCGRELSLPAHVWPAWEFATTVEEFAVQDMPDCLDSEGKLTLATRLVREGVLQSGETDPT